MRIGILADVHANVKALRAALADGEGRVDRWWFLGDAVGRGPAPVQTLLLLREYVNTRYWLVGNHDAYVVELLPWPKGARVEDQIVWLDHQQQLRDHREGGRAKLRSWCRRTWTWQRSRPRVVKGKLADYCFVHAELGEHELNVGNSTGSYLFPYRETKYEARLSRQFDLLQHKRIDERPIIMVHGHTHIPYITALRSGETRRRLLSIHYGQSQPLDDFNTVIINPGSAGQPRNGDPMSHAAYGILDIGSSSFEFRRVPYDSEPTRLAMSGQGYPSDLVQRFGYDPAANANDYHCMAWRDTYEPQPWGWEVKER